MIYKTVETLNVLLKKLEIGRWLESDVSDTCHLALEGAILVQLFITTFTASIETVPGKQLLLLHPVIDQGLAVHGRLHNNDLNMER